MQIYDWGCEWAGKGLPLDSVIGKQCSYTDALSFFGKPIVVNDELWQNNLHIYNNAVVGNSETINELIKGMKGDNMFEYKIRFVISDVKKVIINDPATIILWKDGSKTVVKCTENDEFDPEKGILLALVKHMLFEDSSTRMSKWMDEQTKTYEPRKKEADVKKEKDDTTESDMLNSGTLAELFERFIRGDFQK